MALFEKPDQAYLIFKEGSSSSRTSWASSVLWRRRMEGTYFKHSGSNKKVRERIVKVQPVWTKYFAPPVEEEEEPTANSTE
jgi:hypothetical protein